MADTGWASRAKLADDLGVTCDTVRGWQDSNPATVVLCGPKCLNYSPMAMRGDVGGPRTGPKRI